jgi:hypothetical protein
MENDVRTAALQEWVDTLTSLWTAFGKVPEAEGERIQEYAKALDVIPQGLLERVIERCKRECKFFPQINEIWMIMLQEIGGSRGQDIENLIEDWLDWIYWGKCSIPFVSTETEVEHAGE